VILNITYGSGMQVPLVGVTGDSEHYVWLGNGSAVGFVTGDSEHYVWLRNGGAIVCCDR
jgi:hypothetical protein